MTELEQYMREGAEAAEADFLSDWHLVEDENGEIVSASRYGGLDIVRVDGVYKVRFPNGYEIESKSLLDAAILADALEDIVGEIR